MVGGAQHIVVFWIMVGGAQHIGGFCCLHCQSGSEGGGTRLL
jgi:hypothetical protein